MVMERAIERSGLNPSILKFICFVQVPRADSRADFDRRSDPDLIPNVIDFFVGESDTAEGPVIEPMRGAYGAFAIG